MPFKNKNYRLLWLANTIASFSGHVSMIAFPLVAVRHLGASAWEMGLLIAVEVLPFVLFSLPAGTLVDRFNTQKIVFWSFVALALVTVIVPLAFTFSVLSMPILYIAGFLMGAIMCLEGTAAQVLTTELVSRKGLVEANSWMMGTESGLKLIAPAAGGLMVEAFGAPTTLWCEVVLIGIATLVLSRIVHSGERERPAAAPMTTLIAQGLRAVWHSPVLRTAAAVVMVWQLLWHGVYALIVLYATRDLGLSAAQLGLAVAFGAAGVLLGTVSTSFVEKRWGLGKGMIAGLGLAGVGWGLMALAQPVALAFGGAQSVKFGLFALAYVVMDFGLTVGFVCYISLRQAAASDVMLGRVVATMRWLNLMLAPFGSVLLGALAHGSGTAVAIGVAALACVALTLVAAFTHLIRVAPGVMAPEPLAASDHEVGGHTALKTDVQTTSIEPALSNAQAAAQHNRDTKTA
jgi:hypothetical protein